MDRRLAIWRVRFELEVDRAGSECRPLIEAGSTVRMESDTYAHI
jgi:hypothetical protein